MKMYVVLGENGEYSDRDVWVSGVFATREEAENMVITRMAMNREYLKWQKNFWIWVKANDPDKYFKSWPMSEEKRKYYKDHGEPEYERAERCAIKEVEIGEWIQE